MDVLVDACAGSRGTSLRWSTNSQQGDGRYTVVGNVGTSDVVFQMAGILDRPRGRVVRNKVED